jgi:hypothetical protein
VEECEIDLAVPGFVDGGEMLGGFFDKGQHDEAEELVWDAGFDDVFDALDEEDGEEGDDGEREDERDDAFCKGEFGLGEVFVVVEVGVFVGFEDFVEEGVLGARIVPDEAGVFVRRCCGGKILCVWGFLHAECDD